ncbi:hypothetical protein [Methylobacterium sp. 391_Methyba4]|uniref:hypothetical protein n=1 Tax=Methylobacterium sp. 391_Methyba4 TaxID=3038924 RepID=UPI00241F29F6|nr:hypothetical protein [Methylobacterium sp. 391_Methyba4]WFS08177.1 hypothetical protein P9K36_02430 [Methylobacterium sp. 391_Methyba4]
MHLMRWLTSKIIGLFLGETQSRRANTMSKEREAGTFEGGYSTKSRQFESDYNAATRMLKLRIDERFPDSYYARLSSDRNSSYDYGQDRALAIDTISTAIAMALRGGASVEQAAAAGAASVRI